MGIRLAKSAKTASAGLLVFLILAAVGCGGTQQTAITQPEAQPPQAQQPAAQQPEAQQGYVVQDNPGETVSGRVLLNGQPPAPQKVTVRATCGSEILTYPVRVVNGGIVDAVVWIDGMDRGKPFAFPAAELDQRKCIFVPHILLMQPGEMTVRSQDPVPHNIHTFAEFNRNYNLSMNQVNTITMTLGRPERVRIGCDLHEWMKSFVIVAPHPYYVVTGEGGTFGLDRVPPGRYSLKAWQETLGEMEKEIVVESGKTTTVELAFQSQ